MKKTIVIEELTYICEECGTEIYTCDKCDEDFEAGDELYCSNGGGKHIHTKCKKVK